MWSGSGCSHTIFLRECVHRETAPDLFGQKRKWRRNLFLPIPFGNTRLAFLVLWSNRKKSMQVIISFLLLLLLRSLWLSLECEIKSSAAFFSPVPISFITSISIMRMRKRSSRIEWRMHEICNFLEMRSYSSWSELHETLLCQNKNVTNKFSRTSYSC